MRSWFWLLTCSALLPPAGALANPPARVEIAYEIARNGMTLAEVRHLLEHDGRIYQITETWKGRGLLALRGNATRTSRGIVSAKGLKPLEFTDERTGRDTARAKFDWQTNTLTMQYKGDPRTEPLPAHAHDRLAFLFDFAFAPPLGRQVAFDLLDGRGQSHHVYTVAGRERLETPLGKFDALKLTRTNDGDRTDIWLAADRSYIPLRVLVTESDGTRYDQMATKISAQ